MFSNLKLPWWMSGAELTKLKNAAVQWFELVLTWTKWPLMQFDPLQCSPGILNLIAWQRDIRRFQGESLELFRKRVAYAYANAQDAGSFEGFIKICYRLGIGHIATTERIPGWDWDVINIYLSDEQLSENPDLLKEIIQQYGRTCRRYNFVLETPVQLTIGAFEVCWNQSTIKATLPNLGIRLQGHEVASNSQTIKASLLDR